MIKTAISDVQLLDESISNAWVAYYVALSQQLDKCSNESNGCDKCPASRECYRVWCSVVSIKTSLTANDFLKYSSRFVKIRCEKLQCLEKSRCYP
jgi:hypothetical protein